MLQHAFDHIFAPVDEYNMWVLRKAVLCGVLAFALIIVGINQMITLVVYILAIGLVCVFTWLYSLSPDIRTQVVRRVRDVLKAFWCKCVDDSFGQDNGMTKQNLERHERHATKNECNVATHSDCDGERAVLSTRLGSDGDSAIPSHETGNVHTGSSKSSTGSVSSQVDELSKDFTNLFAFDKGGLM